MRVQIVAAAKSILVRGGLTAWTVDAVAREAGCAKGLVHYHHRSKSDLLAQVASVMRTERLQRRLGALERSGTAALDALWEVLVAEVDSGACAAWLSLATLSDPAVRGALTLREEEAAEFGQALTRALGLAVAAAETTCVVTAALDGVQVPLLLGEPRDAVREVYHRFWLALVR